MVESQRRENNIYLKMVLLGDERIGKTSLVNRYLYDTFDESCPHT